MKKDISDFYKIIIRAGYAAISSIVFLLYVFPVAAQDTTLNKYGLWIIDKAVVYNRTVTADPDKKMVDVKKTVPGVLLDLKYASSDNFMAKKLYPPIHTTYIRQKAAEALAAVQSELKKIGWGLKIWDAYRPYSVTEKMWEPVKDDRYAADPKFGSGHNRGAAVDLTIVELKTGKEKDMGTAFDNFSDTAHHAFINLPAEVLANRQLLKKLMEKHGFKPLETEWWHYYLPDAKKYELLDLSFDTL